MAILNPILKQLDDVLNTLLHDKDLKTYFVVDIIAKQHNHFDIFLDADDGVKLNDLYILHKGLNKKVVELNILKEDDFSFELSSPSLDLPIKHHRQYVKNISRKIQLHTKENIQIEGILSAVNDEGIVVIEKALKKKDVDKTHIIQWEHILKTLVIPIF